MPLYMEAIMNILRQMEDRFDYGAFRQKLQAQQFNPGQKAMLNLRLSLLDACLAGGTETNSMTTHFREGQLTIIEYVAKDQRSSCRNSSVFSAYHLRSWMVLLHAGSST
jgi:hypothetical protein